MASDFGDESGEKLTDWMIRIGEDAGKEAMIASADKLVEAFHRAREGLEKGAGAREWAKLDMRDFAALPEYESIKQVIEGELSARGVAHEFAQEAGREFLVFRVKDVHEVSEAFHRLERTAENAKGRAADALGRASRGGRNEHSREAGETAEQAQRPKGPDLDAPATEKQRGYIETLIEKKAIPEAEVDAARSADLTVGGANRILNEHGRYLKLDRDAEPLEQRAEAARRASKALEDARGAGRERNLQPVLGK